MINTGCLVLILLIQIWIGIGILNIEMYCVFLFAGGLKIFQGISSPDRSSSDDQQNLYFEGTSVDSPTIFTSRRGFYVQLNKPLNTGRIEFMYGVGQPLLENEGLWNIILYNSLVMHGQWNLLDCQVLPMPDRWDQLSAESDLDLHRVNLQFHVTKVHAPEWPN